jgi:hypothetical protein
MKREKKGKRVALHKPIQFLTSCSSGGRCGVAAPNEEEAVAAAAVAVAVAVVG